VLFADDTEAMLGCLIRLGVGVRVDPAGPVIEVDGTDGRPPDGPAQLDARLSGTTSRFVLPLLSLGRGRYRLDGAPPLRARPMDAVLDGLRQLGAAVEEEGVPGHLPVTVTAAGLRGGTVRIAGDASSQFVSGCSSAARPWSAGCGSRSRPPWCRAPTWR
jgi:3-phosphoshikimate 1-carboxyvinyltransferase